jgi:hypothetical protein
MAQCVVCGEDLSERKALECIDCQDVFCREHYHGHDCEPVDPDPKESKGVSAESLTDRIANITFSTIGYRLGGVAGALGMVYLVSNIGIFFGVGSGVDALQAIVAFVVAAMLFSLGTFLLVGSYIHQQS